MGGLFQSSWILVDFYWNRDDYTQRYCQFLDEGITQCRASCYLDDLLEQRQNETSDTNILSTQKVKIIEFANADEINIHILSNIHDRLNGHKSDQYHYDYHQFIFHPPKA